ncbi:MAG: Cys-tRNA(Pro) deacylase [Actinomycetota bacterium]|nr:Cys-tRNA(Pro) deacylase [Actinomycetota bacterium]
MSATALRASVRRWLAPPAIVAAERAGISFSVHAYEHDPNAGSYGLEAVERLGLESARVFKTLVVEVDGKLAVAIVPAAAQLDLKAFGGKRAALVDRTRAERATGYVLGGISPLGMRKPLSTTLDASAFEHATIYVSAGRRGLELELDPRDLARLTDATMRSVARG